MHESILNVLKETFTTSSGGGFLSSFTFLPMFKPVELKQKHNQTNKVNQFKSVMGITYVCNNLRFVHYKQVWLGGDIWTEAYRPNL